jgi:predicted lipoprotein
MDVLLRANTNTYPADTTGIESKISSASYDLSTASDLKKKGLPALDYLFFGSKNLSGKNRVNYAKAVAADLQKLSSEVVKAWKSSGGNYLSTYTSSTGSDVGSSIGMTINAINQHLERYLREGKIGIPNGERSFSGTPLPQNVEATYEGSNSLKYALENLKAIERIYLGKSLDGTDGVGLEENLNALGATYNSGSLDEAVKNQIEACYTAFNKVSLPLNQAVVSQNERVSELYTELQKLVVLFKADIPSALGVLITYQDNDGD